MSPSAAPAAYATYLRHGVRLSTNLPLPGQPERAPDADVRITYREAPIDAPLLPTFSRRWTHENGRTELAFESGNHHCLRFTYDESAASVDILNTVEGDAAAVAAIFSGPGLAVLLSLRGALVLHGSAVAVNGKAVLFVGPSGSGKSTLAAALSAAGASFVSEEIVSVRHGGATSQVGYGCPRIGLEPDAAACFGGSPLPLAYPGRPAILKRWIYVEPQAEGSHEAIDVGAVYVLGSRGVTEPDAPAQFERTPPVDATVALLHALYPRTGMFPDRNMRDVARLVDRLPVWSLRLPGSLAALPHVARSVIAHAATLLAE